MDGLRALAVAAVVVFHAFPWMAPGGFVGVDVFFVISGFLISGIILRAVEQRTFSLTDFYVRRLRRILPALLVVLVACLAAGYAFWLVDEWESLGRMTFAGALFHANIAAAGEPGGYFTALGGRTPLLHLWSLGVEEQFYLAWPILFAAIVRWFRRPLVAIVVLLAGSFVLNLAWVYNTPADAYFLPFSRLWELLVGALLVFVTGGQRAMKPMAAQVAALAGLALILFACVSLDGYSTFPGWWAWLPTLGAALVIAAGPQAAVNRWGLSARPMVWLGLISYPLYLWHWPLLVFGRAVWMDSRFWPGTLLLVVVSVVLAYLTYRLVELRVRTARGWTVPVALAAALVAVAAVGDAVAEGRVRSRLTTLMVSAPTLIKATSDWSYTFTANFRKRAGFVGAEVNGGRDRAVIFIGDSYLEQYWPRVDYLVKAAPLDTPTVRFFTRGGCAPLRHRESRGRLCGDFLDAALSAAAQPDVQTVVFGGFWESYFDTGRLGEAAVRPLIQPGSETEREVFAAFADMVRSLRAAGKQVFVLLTSPTDPAFDPRFLVSRLTGKRLDAPVPVGAWRAQVGPVLARLSEAAGSAGAVILDPVPWVCDGDTCAVVGPGGEPTHADRGHMRPWFVIERATFLDQVLR